MQDAGRCGASCLLEIHPCPQLAFPQGEDEAVPRPWPDSAVTLAPRSHLPEMGKRFSLLLSSSGGGLFDGRPKTQTWVWGAFVFATRKLTPTCGILFRSEAVSQPWTRGRAWN